MSNKRNAYLWSGVVKSDLKVEVCPSSCRPGELVNLSVQSSETYRSDIDGVWVKIFCDNEFDVKITHKENLLMLMQSKEVLKYWCSTVEEAVERAKWLVSRNIPVYYIYKEAENYYTYYTVKLEFSNYQLVETIRWEEKVAEVG